MCFSACVMSCPVALFLLNTLHVMFLPDVFCQVSTPRKRKKLQLWFLKLTSLSDNPDLGIRPSTWILIWYWEVDVLRYHCCILTVMDSCCHYFIQNFYVSVVLLEQRSLMDRTGSDVIQTRPSVAGL